MGQCAARARREDDLELLDIDALRSASVSTVAPPDHEYDSERAASRFRWRVTSSAEVLADFGAVFHVVDRRRLSVLSLQSASPLAETVRGGSFSARSTSMRSTATFGRGISRTDAAALYARSKPAPLHGCDRFISHSWSSSRRAKHLALLYTHHHTGALVLACGLFLFAAVPALTRHVSEDAAGRYASHEAFDFLIGWPCVLYAAVLLFGHRLPAVLGVSLRQSCFLDRLCIHQSDGVLKQLGVEHLDVALRSCRELTVLWSEDYFERLWCIFELAIASRELGPLRIKFVPLWLPPFLLVVSAASVVAVVVAFAVERSALYLRLLHAHGAWGAASLWIVVGALPSLVTCALLRVKVRSHERSMAQVSLFALDSARVSVESDRPIVEAELTNLWGSTRAFETYVRTELHEHVRAAIGAPFAIPYGWMAFMFLPYACLGVVDSVSLPLEVVAALAHAHGAPASPSAHEFALRTLAYYALFAFGACPLALRQTCLATYAGRRLPFLLGWAVDVLVLNALLYAYAYLDAALVAQPLLGEALGLLGRISPGVEFAAGWSPVAASIAPSTTHA